VPEVSQQRRDELAIQLLTMTRADRTAGRNASRSNGLTERSPEPLIGFDQLRVLIRRGNRRL
jgi:hypothetical protein